jgi:hypothetical protein
MTLRELRAPMPALKKLIFCGAIVEPDSEDWEVSPFVGRHATRIMTPRVSYPSLQLQRLTR